MSRYRATRGQYYPPAITAVNIVAWLLEWLQPGSGGDDAVLLAPRHFFPTAGQVSAPRPLWWECRR